MNPDEEYEKYANERKREWGNTGELQEVGVRIPHLYFSAPSPRARDFFNRSSCKISLLPRRSLFSDRVTYDNFEHVTESLIKRNCKKANITIFRLKY